MSFVFDFNKTLSLIYIKGNDNLMQRNSICSLQWWAVLRTDGFCFLITSWHIKQIEDLLSTSGVNFTCGSCLIRAYSGGFQLSSGSEAVHWAPRGVVKSGWGEEGQFGPPCWNSCPCNPDKKMSTKWKDCFKVWLSENPEFTNLHWFHRIDVLLIKLLSLQNDKCCIFIKKIFFFFF